MHPAACWREGERRGLPSDFAALQAGARCGKEQSVGMVKEGFVGAGAGAKCSGRKGARQPKQPGG